LNDSEIELFKNHNSMMYLASKRKIALKFNKVFSNYELNQHPVVETWPSFAKTFGTSNWAFVDAAHFKW